MPRYFFDFRDDERRNCDADGMELANLDDVKKIAATSLAEIALELLPYSSERRLGVDVRDDKHRLVLTTELTFKAVEASS